jgi:hypothetical protein
MYTEFLFDEDALQELVVQKATALKDNRGLSDFAGFALGVVYRRLEKDSVRYRDYGPYWWSLKMLLRDAGYDVGADDDASVREIYRGRDAAMTIVMADQFRELYLKCFILGTNQFVLDGYTNDVWTLVDEGMESR